MNLLLSHDEPLKPGVDQGIVSLHNVVITNSLLFCVGGKSCILRHSVPLLYLSLANFFLSVFFLFLDF